MSGRQSATGGKDRILDDRLDRGLWNDKPIYIHFTSAAGYDGINLARTINATPKQDRRGGRARNGVYLNPSTQAFGPQDAFTLLFFDSEAYRLSALYAFVFAFHATVAVEDDAISSGSWVREIIYRGGDIGFSDVDILYRGPNPFVDNVYVSR